MQIGDQKNEEGLRLRPHPSVGYISAAGRLRTITLRTGLLPLLHLLLSPHLLSGTMYCGSFTGAAFPGCYWGSYGYPLGYSVGCGYGSTYSPVGYGCGYGYGGCGGALSYRRYWPYALY